MADTGAYSSGQNYPNLNPNLNPSGINDTTTSSSGSAPNGNTMQNMKDSVISNSQSAMNTVANHPITQNITNGPVAEKARIQADKTSNEFSNVYNSKRVPDQKAATGQPLTHYHSLFYNVLSWENPRATGISYASIITMIFITRYVPLLSFVLKGTYIILGIIAAAEVSGKLIFDQGLASRMRPRKYYTIPRESLERSLEDVEQLINFFVIEFQRIIFAENVYATVAAFATALTSFLLVKFVPKWGIALIATTFVYFAPLIYIKNKHAIDHHLNNASTAINQQASQARDLAVQHTSRASEAAKSTVSQYSAKAQEMVGQGKQQAKDSAASPNAPNPGNVNPMKTEPERDFNQSAGSANAPNPGNLNPYKNEPERDLNQSAGSANAPNPGNLNPFKNEPERDLSQSAGSSNAPNPGNFNPFKNEPAREVSRSDFPSAPGNTPATSSSFPDAPHHETGFGGTEHAAQPSQY